MLPPDKFELFATPHLTTILVIVTVALMLPLAVRFLAPSATRTVAYLLAAVLLLQEGIKAKLWVDILGWSPYLLPLDLCTLTVFLSAWMLVTRSRRLFEIAYFWGLGGTTQALLTPDLQESFPAVSYLLFFLGHGGIIVALFFAMFVFGLRPYLDSIPRVIAITAAVAALAFAVNLAFGTNFMFLMAKPNQPSLLDLFGPWPWYLIGLVALSLLSFALLYLPFLTWDSIRRKKSLQKDAPRT
jgi:hypothetical integral membrane protein (TIGR02206 family)